MSYHILIIDVLILEFAIKIILILSKQKNSLFTKYWIIYDPFFTK